jgi:hypothetical protein
MADGPDAIQIRALARSALRGGVVKSDLVVASGRVEAPIAIQAPEGPLHSWFVPVTVRSQLAGFFQFLASGAFMRFSSFQRRADDLAGCPPAADWLDLERIASRAGARARSGEKTGKPFLTYDRSPDRLVWAVPLIQSPSEARLLYVAGEVVCAPTSAESTG